MARELPRFLAPLTGVIAFASCVAMVALHVYGASLPQRHVAEVVGTAPIPPDQVWTMITDVGRRAEWRPRVVRVGPRPVDGDRAVWSEVDDGGDRFDLVVVSDVPPTLVIATARPEDIGMYAEWRWSVAPDPGGGSRITVREEGSIRNDLVRGYWSLWTGKYAGIEPDLRAFVAWVGGDPATVKRLD